MGHAYLQKTLASGLVLSIASAAAPIALADVPGYLFQGFDQHSPASASDGVAGIATDAQIAAANQKADRALASAQQALWEAQQNARNARSDMPDRLGGRKN